jgi:peptidoglycan/LPS O-acetylase OafA/YrhL
VYHHFISYYLDTNQIDLELALWLGSHSAAVALQTILGVSASLAVAYISYEIFEKRFIYLKRLFATARGPVRERSVAVGTARETLSKRDLAAR